MGKCILPEECLRPSKILNLNQKLNKSLIHFQIVLPMKYCHVAIQHVMVKDVFYLSKHAWTFHVKLNVTVLMDLQESMELVF